MISLEKRRRRPIPRTVPRKWTDRLTIDEIRRALPTDDHSDTASDLSVGTPSSIHIHNAYSLSRDLSDLSGSHAPRPTSWHQAHILSSREPLHPQPPPDGDDSVRMGKSLVMKSSERIEVIQQDRSVRGPDFCPIIILLMDPNSKIYELMQLWIDAQFDTVRDILHSIQSSVGERWRQDYDGMLQWRNQHWNPFTVSQVHPFELLVAKPWSMPAPTTIAHASAALQRFLHLGVVQTVEPNLIRPSVKQPAESYVRLSPRAQSRIHVRGEVFQHHHACQFLSFSPPFEEPAIEVRVDVLGADEASSCVSNDVPVATVFTAQRELQPTQVRVETSQIIHNEKNKNEISRTPETVPCSDSIFQQPIASEEERFIEQFDTEEPIRKFREHPRRRRLKDVIELFKCQPCRIEQDMESSQRTLWLDQTPSYRDAERPLWESVWEFDGNESVVSETEPLLFTNSSDLAYQLELYRCEI